MMVDDDDCKAAEKMALGEFEKMMQLKQKCVCSLPLTPDEAVKLHAQLVMAPSFNGKAALIERLGSMLVQALHRAAKTDQVLKIAKKLATGMQAELYIRKQEHKIAELENAGDPAKTTSSSDDEFKNESQRSDAARKTREQACQGPFPGDAEMGDGEIVDIDLDDDDDDVVPVREYPRSSAPKPTMPHSGGRRRGRRRH